VSNCRCAKSWRDHNRRLLQAASIDPPHPSRYPINVQFRIPRSALAAAAATRAGSEVLVNTMTRMTIRAQR
jgi:hypothetical protein